MHVERSFSWRRTFERLFGTIYPKALAHAAARTRGARIWSFGGVTARAG